jgi:hypothetical protein
MQEICCFVENTSNREAYCIFDHQQVHFNIGFFASKVNQFRDSFLDLKSLNSDYLQTIVEFKGFGSWAF